MFCRPDLTNWHLQAVLTNSGCDLSSATAFDCPCVVCGKQHIQSPNSFRSVQHNFKLVFSMLPTICTIFRYHGSEIHSFEPRSTFCNAERQFIRYSRQSKRGSNSNSSPHLIAVACKSVPLSELPVLVFSARACVR